MNPASRIDRLPPVEPPTAPASADELPSSAPASWLAGAASIEITPPVGIELAGFVAREQPSVAVRDPLTATALYLEVGSRKLMWIAADVIGFDSTFVGNVEGAIASSLGMMPGQDLVLTATHTHSGPPTFPLINCGEITSQTCGYLETLHERLLIVAQQAAATARPARAFAGFTELDLAIDRRGKPSAHVDRQLCAVAFVEHGPDVGEGGQPIAVLVNLPIHPVVLGPENRGISGDLFGVAACKLREGLLGNPEVLMTNGACGNLNPPSRGGDAELDAWGGAIAEAAMVALDGAEEMMPILASISRAAPIPIESFELPDRTDRIAGLYRLFQDDEEPWNVRSRDAIRRWTAMMLEAPQRPLELELQAIQIGRVLFACFGGEVFSKMAPLLRQRFGQRLHVVGYANGSLGYLCPEEAYDEGGYEVESAFLYYGTPPIRRGSFELALERMTSLLLQT